LADSIKKLAAEKQLFSRNPGKDNTRNRKLPFEKVVAAILSFQGGTLNRELMDFFDLNSASPTTSAFAQQRAKMRTPLSKITSTGEIEQRFRLN